MAVERPEPLANILVISKTLLTFHDASDWLNEVAPLNIPFIFVTLVTFQDANDWLNEVAPANIKRKDVALLVFHAFRF